jgi:hypothetical protein
MPLLSYEALSPARIKAVRGSNNPSDHPTPAAATKQCTAKENCGNEKETLQKKIAWCVERIVIIQDDM